jgi:predicted glutamine amidotransferase
MEYQLRVGNPLQMTLGICNGRQLFAVRYSSEHQSRSLYHSNSMQSLQQLYPELLEFSADACAVVSEPLNQLSDEWTAVPESSCIKASGGNVSVEPPPIAITCTLETTISKRYKGVLK